jgi:hypothetical protein
MAIRIPVPLVIELTDDQEAVYCEEYGLVRDGVMPLAREVAESVRAAVLAQLQHGPVFCESGATITIKGR